MALQLPAAAAIHYREKLPTDVLARLSDTERLVESSYTGGYLVGSAATSPDPKLPYGHFIASHLWALRESDDWSEYYSRFAYSAEAKGEEDDRLSVEETDGPADESEYERPAIRPFYEDSDSPPDDKEIDAGFAYLHDCLPLNGELRPRLAMIIKETSVKVIWEHSQDKKEHLEVRGEHGTLLGALQTLGWIKEITGTEACHLELKRCLKSVLTNSFGFSVKAKMKAEQLFLRFGYGENAETNLAFNIPKGTIPKPTRITITLNMPQKVEANTIKPEAKTTAKGKGKAEKAPRPQNMAIKPELDTLMRHIIRHENRVTHSCTSRTVAGGHQRDSKVRGHNGNALGLWAPFRVCMARDGVHAPPMAGIAGTEETGVDSVVYSDAYAGVNEDHGHYLLYAGPQSATNTDATAVPRASGTRALQRALRRTGPASYVRVVRKGGNANVWGPRTGFRYDGLYTVVAQLDDHNALGGKYTKFRLEGVPGQYQAVQLCDREPTDREKTVMVEARDYY